MSGDIWDRDIGRSDMYLNRHLIKGVGYPSKNTNKRERFDAYFCVSQAKPIKRKLFLIKSRGTFSYLLSKQKSKKKFPRI